MSDGGRESARERVKERQTAREGKTKGERDIVNVCMCRYASCTRSLFLRVHVSQGGRVGIGVGIDVLLRHDKKCLCGGGRRGEAAELDVRRP